MTTTKHMIGQTIRKYVCLCISIFMIATLLPLSAGAAVKYMPDVTSEMCTGDYWANKTSNQNEVLVDQGQIQSMNARLCAKGAPMWDLPNWEDGTFNGVKASQNLVNGARSDLEYDFRTNGTRFDQEGNAYPNTDAGFEAWLANYQTVIENAADPYATEDMPYRYAVCTNRTCLQSLPTDMMLLDDATDPDFDYLYLTGMKVNEPVVIRTQSADGRYYSVYSASTNGWIPAEDVAVCQDINEWKAAWNMPEEKTLVICDDSVSTENSNSTPETANRKIPMGSWLRLADESEWTGLISNRSAHNNHVVWLPIRNEDGTFSEKLALIGENRYVSEGYLPLTYKNIMKVAFRWLGNCYGWGGMLGSEDCSGYIRDVYRCFGLNMVRSAKERDKSYMKFFDLSGMSTQEKAEVIATLPPGAILSFPGHEMMYLGSEGDKLYVISEVSSVMLDGQRTRIRNCIVNTLDIKRASGRSWLEETFMAEIPYYDPDTQWPPDVPAPEPTPTPDPADGSDADISVAAPVIKTTVTLKKSSIRISWGEVKNAEMYKVFYRKAGASGWSTKWASGTSDTIKGLTKDGLYQFKVRAFRENSGKSVYSSDSNTAYRYIKEAVKFKAKAKKKKIKLKWKKNTKVYGYQIRYATSKSMKNAKVINITGATKTGYTIKGLKKGKRYYVKVAPVVMSGGVKYMGVENKTKKVKVK